MIYKTPVSAAEPERLEREFFGSHEDRPEDRSVSSRAHIRSALSDQVQAFLSGGGKISEVEPLLRTDLPRKPSSEYRGRPI
ncbi:hypothetical protein F6455_11985 [Proteobacteria bacterium 005FR1]|nr:hypothetical protein [Proteobacteria bacterium 005FR1]